MLPCKCVSGSKQPRSALWADKDGKNVATMGVIIEEGKLPSEQRRRFLTEEDDGDCSLLIQRIMRRDEGAYRCIYLVPSTQSYVWRGVHLIVKKRRNTLTPTVAVAETTNNPAPPTMDNNHHISHISKDAVVNMLLPISTHSVEPERGSTTYPPLLATTELMVTTTPETVMKGQHTTEEIEPDTELRTVTAESDPGNKAEVTQGTSETTESMLLIPTTELETTSGVVTAQTTPEIEMYSTHPGTETFSPSQRTPVIAVSQYTAIHEDEDIEDSPPMYEDNDMEGKRRAFRSIQITRTKAVNRLLKDPLLKLAQKNVWYQWMSFTGRSHTEKDCYMCSKAKESTLVVMNTRYSWKNCAKMKAKWVKSMQRPKLSSQFDIDLEAGLTPYCEAECLQLLGSREYFNATSMKGLLMIDLRDLESPVKTVGDRCAELDVRVDNRLRSVPVGTELDIIGPFECFEKVGTKNVGQLKDSLCETIWDLTYKHPGKADTYNAECAGFRSKVLAGNPKKGNQTKPRPGVCPYHYATQAVADQFWLCGEDVLLNTLPIHWHGRCARVQAIQAVIVIPPEDLIRQKEDGASRYRRQADGSETKVFVNSLGFPVGVPKEGKAINDISTGIASIFLPQVGITMNTAWINYIYWNQQRFVNATHEALGALGRQLAATSDMAWQNRQALDFLLAEKGGVCEMFGDQCCTYLPNTTAPEGSFSKAMARIKDLRQEITENAGANQKWTGWLESLIGGWGAVFLRIGLMILVGLVVIGLVFCCCVPIIRGLISKGINKALGIQALQMAVRKYKDCERLSLTECDPEQNLGYGLDCNDSVTAEEDY